MAAKHARALRNFSTHLEELEPRRLLAGYDPTAAAQLFLLELNQARANPAAYGASIGVDLSGVAPAPPLAFDPRLVEAAQLHSEDMNNQAYFNHVTPQGEDVGDRLTSVLYPWTTYGESIAGGPGLTTPAAALSDLIIDAGVPDLGHREQLLAMTAEYSSQNQVGIGIVQSGSGPLANYYTIDTASSTNTQPDLTGVVYNDINGNGQYDVGEGLAGVTITVAGAGSTTTFSSGGYTLPVNPGTYTVTASGGGLRQPITETVTVGTVNAQVNFVEEPPNVVVFAVTAADGLERYDNVHGWTTIGAAGTIAAISTVTDASGSQVVYAITTSKALYRYSDVSGWAQIGGAGTIQSISAGTDARGAADVFVITTGGDFYEFSSAGWSPIAGPGVVQSMSAAGNGDAYVVKPNGSVYGYAPAWGLYPLTSPGFAQSVTALTATGGTDVVFAVTRGQGLFMHTAAGGWIQLGAAGTIELAAAGTDAIGQAVVDVVTAGGALYAFDTLSGWLPLGGPSSLTRLTPTVDDVLVAITSNEALYEYAPASGWFDIGAAGFVAG